MPKGGGTLSRTLFAPRHFTALCPSRRYPPCMLDRYLADPPHVSILTDSLRTTPVQSHMGALQTIPITVTPKGTGCWACMAVARSGSQAAARPSLTLGWLVAIHGCQVADSYWRLRTLLTLIPHHTCCIIATRTGSQPLWGGIVMPQGGRSVCFRRVAAFFSINAAVVHSNAECT
jgi:hypothetical protein